MEVTPHDEKLAREVASHGAAIRHIESLIEGLSTRIEHLFTDLQEAKQRPATQWGVIIAAVGALGSFILLYTQPIAGATNSNERDILRLEEADRQSRLLHAERGQVTENLKIRIDSLDRTDERLVRFLEDMRDWMAATSNTDATQSEKISELERQRGRFEDTQESIADLEAEIAALKVRLDAD